jgi:SAM-dependent methyltransferase
MLNEHLTQEHDHASRRSPIIQQHVDWIHVNLLGGTPGKVLDLGCGPGLYCSRLAGLGHTCHGIDFSPASIDYAQGYARKHGLDCTYLLQDLRRAEFGEGYDLAMFIFGEFNAFRPPDARLILQKAWRALKPGGRLLLEVSTFKDVKRMASGAASWYCAAQGLFSERPHLLLSESYWHLGQRVACERFYVVDLETAEVQPFSNCIQAYHVREYRKMLRECGFEGVRVYPSLGETPVDGKWLAITGQKFS